MKGWLMATDDNKEPYTPPQAATTNHRLAIGDATLAYDAHVDWILLRERERPIAEMFHVFYEVTGEDRKTRPITFVFNGGPGAASAYLHLGGLGPKRVRFNADGTAPPPPAVLDDNVDTWLSFTDLVFIDPVGTGFSRTIDKQAGARGDKGDTGSEKEAAGKGLSAKEKEFYQLERDLDSLCEFIVKFLSKHRRWGAPVFIAGESYGGFRVAKLARRLQEVCGVGLSGAILISPALEWYFLASSDYDILFWINAFPSMALTAAFHGKSTAFDKDTPPALVREQAERFAGTDLVMYLAQGDAMESSQRQAITARIAAMLGLSLEYVERRRGRVGPFEFARLLLRSEHRYCGLYDSTITAIDPFPGRDTFEGPDPTLFAIGRLFASGVNVQLRDVLGVDSARDYHLLSLMVNEAWKVDTKKHALETHVGSVDDLRYAMSLNPHMKVFITHGYYDLVTPYYAADRVKNLMALDARLKRNLQVQHFGGGHMFYSWEDSRRAFTQTMREFYSDACVRG
jgi:carboxypeptidase C (cathepsin A)